MTTRRALFVGNFLSASGHRHYCEDLCDRLEGHDWKIVRTSAYPGRVRRLVDMMRVAWRKRGDYALGHVDVFSGPAFVWAEAVTFELRRLGKPVVMTLRGGRLPEFAARWKRRVRTLLSAATVITSPSPYLREAFRGHDIVVVPNALDVGSYPLAAPITARNRLIWVRAFHAIYNPVLAVEVLARLPTDVTLVMVGKDAGDGTLAATREAATRLGVANRLEIIPGVPKREVAARLVTGDIFLNTADVDNTPISVLEAMACGLCVVSTDPGGIPYMLAHEHDALLVPPCDATAMARAIERLRTDRELANRLSTNARAHALTCDWSNVLAQWDQVYSRAARA